MARARMTTPSLARCLFEIFLFLLLVNFAAAGSAFGENKILQIQEENKLSPILLQDLMSWEIS